MKFTCHIFRARGIEHLAMTGKINGKKSRGRQRTTYIDSLNTWANLEQHTRSQFMSSSCERQIWKNHDRQCLLQARHLMMMMVRSKETIHTLAIWKNNNSPATN
ncbi:hypothetical protein ElyMa_001677200 [Elysia marginata]|uniref:Uncharacterized protein n=1 Tax=Elysia marginata TaxID=1093978 RepID=A0AAV4JTI5_9GAST|nr:hypothetical protein ElyMa_001677200 [Elysia marginata]